MLQYFTIHLNYTFQEVIVNIKPDECVHKYRNYQKTKKEISGFLSSSISERAIQIGILY
jgi:hypothetical protein